jgi:hypothetical protein
MVKMNTWNWKKSRLNSEKICFSLFSLFFFHTLQILSLFNWLFFHIFHIFSLFNLFFFRIFHIFSLFSSIFSISFYNFPPHFQYLFTIQLGFLPYFDESSKCCDIRHGLSCWFRMFIRKLSVLQVHLHIVVGSEYSWSKWILGTERKVDWIVKRYGKYGRKESRKVKRYEKFRVLGGNSTVFCLLVYLSGFFLCFPCCFLFLICTSRHNTTNFLLLLHHQPPPRCLLENCLFCKYIYI